MPGMSWRLKSTYTIRVIAGVLLASVILPPALSRAATPEQIDGSLARAKAFLYSKRHDDNWETAPKRIMTEGRASTSGGQWGGRTAIAVYALLASGEDPQGAKLAPSIRWLKTADIVGTYALSMRCQVWFILPRTAETKKLAEADRERIQGAFDDTVRTKGTFLYSYLTDKRDINMVDHSVSQFGVLSMWACAQLGLEIPTRYWADVEKRWTFDQKPDGGWWYADYTNTADHTGEQASMTAAGVATLFITQDYVHQSDGIKCIGNIKNEHIDLGLKWMADHTAEWTPRFAFGGFELPGYTLYGVERIGVASGLKYFGTVDWYQFGADWCMSNQGFNGDWGGGDNIPNTALCILFLARGRAPVLINKVQYDNATGSNAGQAGPWNQRPRDVANFVRWMTVQTERDINWQITNLDVPESEMHDAPFLYFSGNKAISLKPEEIEKVKQFILHGGMVLFNSDCGNAATANPFIVSVSKLGKAMFPSYEFRDLPDSHPIFTNEQYPQSRWKRKVVFRGLSNGVRELMIMMPNDPAKAWQLQETGGTGREEAYQGADDLILYGTDKENLLVKGQSFLIKKNETILATKTVKIARLKYDRNWNPEPGGWERLDAMMHNKLKVDVTTETVELDDKPITDFKIAHLTGTGSFTLTAPQQQQLKDFVSHGGTLVVEAAGGSGEFAQSAEAMLNKMYPDQLKDPLPASDPVFSTGVPKAEIRYRHYARAQVLGGTRAPQLKAISIDGRKAIYYSRYDLSCGLVGQPIDGVIGYEPDSASEIMSGIIMQASK